HNYKHDSRYHKERDEHHHEHHHHHHHRSRHHKKRDRDINDSRSHWSYHRGHWDRKPDYYEMNVDEKKKKEKRDGNENDGRKIQRRDSKRDPRKNSKINKYDNQSSDDSIVIFINFRIFSRISF